MLWRGSQFPFLVSIHVLTFLSLKNKLTSSVDQDLATIIHIAKNQET